MEYIIEGLKAKIILTQTRVIIRRHGVDSAIVLGVKGDKEIPIKKITAIQFKRPGKTLKNGYIQFTIPGGNESLRGMLAAAYDENSVFFSLEQLQNFETMKSYIDSVIDETPIDFNTLNLPKLQTVNSPDIQKKVIPEITEHRTIDKSKSRLKIRNILLFVVFCYVAFLVSHRCDKKSIVDKPKQIETTAQ